MSGVPDPTPIEPIKLENEATAANGAPTDNSGNATAMQLFAPDPNAGPDQEPLDLDELFHDCYFGDFGVPEDVSSSTIAAVPIPAGEPAAKRTAFADAASAPTSVKVEAPAKRTADQAGLTTPAAPRPVPAPSSVGGLGGISTKPAASLTEVQKVERRERNREHAKRSRLRKKFLLESLQEQIEVLSSSNEINNHVRIY